MIVIMCLGHRILIMRGCAAEARGVISDLGQHTLLAEIDNAIAHWISSETLALHHDPIPVAYNLEIAEINQLNTKLVPIIQVGHCWPSAGQLKNSGKIDFFDRRIDDTDSALPPIRDIGVIDKCAYKRTMHHGRLDARHTCGMIADDQIGLQYHIIARPNDPSQRVPFRRAIVLRVKAKQHKKLAHRVVYIVLFINLVRIEWILWVARRWVKWWLCRVGIALSII